MAVQNKIEFESFDDFAEMLQHEENRKYNNKSPDKITQKSTVATDTIDVNLPQTRRYYRRTTGGPKVISLEEYKQRVKIGNLPPPEEKKTSSTQNISSKKSKEQKDTHLAKRKIKTPKKISSKKTTKKTKVDKNKQKRIASISKQIERNVARQTRYTEPKKRNLLSRIILQQKLSKGKYEHIEENYNTILPQEIEESKNAPNREGRWFYKEVQAYEDAKDDVTVRKGWRTFKVGLGAALLAGSLALGTYLSNEVKQTLNLTQSNAVVSLDTIDTADKEYYDNMAEEFADKVRVNDGYEFDYLSSDELLDGYLRILNKESKMLENYFKGSMYNFADQELLDKIVIKAFGEEEYAMFSEGQKRDYRQLAFELLPTALPEIFGDSILYVRNPIVCDELEAKNNAKAKGYKISIPVNSDEKDAVRNVEKLLHLRNILEAVNFQVDTANDGKDILEDMVKQALGEQYETTSEKDLRDYKQIAYELLPEEAKQNYIKDPIEVEKIAEELEIGD